MKRIFCLIPVGILLLLLFLLSCDKKEPGTYIPPCGVIIKFDACNVQDIGNNLKWLSDIIIASKTDKTLNYYGTIWYKKYKNEDFIVTDMMLGSGGLFYNTFNCSGEFSPIDDISFYNSLSQKDIIYKNICIN